MIDKLEYYSGGVERGNAILWVKNPTLDDFVDKINELVDVINAMTQEREDRAATDISGKWFEKKERLIEQIQGKTPEEIYDFLYWLLITYGNQFTDSRQAVISWLRRDDDGTGV